MKETVLEKKTAYTGTVTFPNKQKFPREIITNLVLDSVFRTNKRRNNNPTDSRYEDYLLGHALAKTALNTYFIDYLAALYDYKVVQTESWGNYLMPNERTQTRNNFQYKDLEHIPCSQVIYGSFIEDTIDVVLELSTHKKQIFKLKNNDYIIFGADVNYNLGKNNSNKPAILFTTLFAEPNEIGMNV
tara:strand:- start:518 stop:1078 length:561 start_codon:yes stop_codon:yes gene_type:complete